MEKLIVLSDLWGVKNSSWIESYTTILKGYFEVKFYDCCKLGELDITDYSEENIHQQFINGGIDKAVENLIKKEKETISVLGFSIGGSIAWKAACQGLKVINLTAVSSTRLRNESIEPNCSIKLFYGDKDPFKTQKDWFDHFELNPKIYNHESHDFYMKQEIAIEICNQIIKNN